MVAHYGTVPALWLSSSSHIKTGRLHMQMLRCPNEEVSDLWDTKRKRLRILQENRDTGREGSAQQPGADSPAACK